MVILEKNKSFIRCAAILIAVIGFSVHAQNEDNTQKKIEEQVQQRVFLEGVLIDPLVTAYREWLEQRAAVISKREKSEVEQSEIATMRAIEPGYVHEDPSIEIFKFREKLVWEELNPILADLAEDPTLRSMYSGYSSYSKFFLGDPDTFSYMHRYEWLDNSSSQAHSDTGYSFKTWMNDDQYFECTGLTLTRPSMQDGDVHTKFTGTCTHNITKAQYPNDPDAKIDTEFSARLNLSTLDAGISKTTTYYTVPATWIEAESMPCREWWWDASVDLFLKVTVRYKAGSGAPMKLVFKHNRHSILAYRGVRIRECR